MADEIVPLAADTSNERINAYIEVWKKTIDVQQHFNDLALRIRNFAITVLGVVLSGTALSLKEGLRVSLIGITVPLGSLLVFVALITWLAFYFMDRFWYHYLLVGAVKHGTRIEQRLKRVLLDIDLTNSISAASPIQIGTRQIHAARKMDIFYLTVAALLLVLMISLIFIPTDQKKTEPDFIINNVMPGAARSEPPATNENANAAPATANHNANNAAPTNAKTGR
jgi:hypothetical protein